MAHPLRNVLQRAAAAQAQTINAAFVEELGGGWLSATLRDTGETIRARRATSLAFTPGQDIILARPDGSGRSRNTGYTALGPASSQIDNAAPIEQETPMVGASITSIEPNPAIITAGDTVAITVLGVGFLSVPEFETAPSYGSPDLTDDVDPVIADTEIDLVVIASPDTAAGDYALSIGTLRTEEIYFQVAAAPAPVLPEHSVWILTYETDDYIPKMYRLDVTDLSIFHNYAFDESDGSITDLAVVDDVIYAKGGVTILRVQNPGGAVLGSVLGLQNTPENAGSIGQSATTLFYGDFFDNIFATFDIDSVTETTRFLNTGLNYISQVLIDGDTAWIAVPDQGTLIQWSISGDVEVTRTSALGTPTLLAQDATHLYVGRIGDIVKVAKADIATIIATSGAYPSGAYATGLNKLQLVNGFLYQTYSGGFARVSLDLSTMNPVDIGDTPYGFAYSPDTLKFYVGDNNGGVTVIDEASMLADGRTVVSGKEVFRLLYV